MIFAMVMLVMVPIITVTNIGTNVTTTTPPLPLGMAIPVRSNSTKSLQAHFLVQNSIFQNLPISHGPKFFFGIFGKVVQSYEKVKLRKFRFGLKPELRDKKCLKIGPKCPFSGHFGAVLKNKDIFNGAPWGPNMNSRANFVRFVFSTCSRSAPHQKRTICMIYSRIIYPSWGAPKPDILPVSGKSVC